MVSPSCALARIKRGKGHHVPLREIQACRRCPASRPHRTTREHLLRRSADFGSRTRAGAQRLSGDTTGADDLRASEAPTVVLAHRAQRRAWPGRRRCGFASTTRACLAGRIASSVTDGRSPGATSSMCSTFAPGSRPRTRRRSSAAGFDYVAELLRDVVRTCAASASARALARGVV